MTVLAVFAPLLSFAFIGTKPLSEPQRERFRALVIEARDSGDASPKQYADVIARLEADPCENVVHELSAPERSALEAGLSRSLSLPAVQVYARLKLGDWSVIYSDISPGDPTYGFFQADPLSGGVPVEYWSGGAPFYEVGDIFDWTTANVPGVPKELAECFAWYVTMGPE